MQGLGRRRTQFSDLPLEQQSNILRYSLQEDPVRGAATLRQTSRQLHNIVQDPYLMGMSSRDDTRSTWEILEKEYERITILAAKSSRIGSDININQRKKASTLEAMFHICERLGVDPSKNQMYRWNLQPFERAQSYAISYENESTRDAAWSMILTKINLDNKTRISQQVSEDDMIIIAPDEQSARSFILRTGQIPSIHLNRHTESVRNRAVQESRREMERRGYHLK